MSTLALLGGPPRFTKPIGLGQGYFPSWERYEAAFRDLFARQYYTNHGPLAARFESHLAELLGVRHAIYMTNATIALMIALDALAVDGKVIVPAYAPPASAQAVRMSGREAVFCDVDSTTHQLTAELVAPHVTEHAAAILASNLGGGACDVAGLELLARQHGLRLLFDSTQAFGCQIGGRSLGSFGTLEVFSFHQANILGTADGACITTNDDDAAAHVRNIRSGYGIGQVVPVVRTSNGRMSEAQAAIGLLQLEALPALLERNVRLYAAYRQALAGVSGVRLIEPSGVSRSNYQCVMVELDEASFGLSRETLLNVLRAENVQVRAALPAAPGWRSAGLAAACPNSEQVRARVFELPIGASVAEPDVAIIGAIVRQAQRHAASLPRV